MNRETEKELVREWGHISEIDSLLLFNGWLFDQFKKLGKYTRKHKKLCEDHCNMGIEEGIILKVEQQTRDFCEGLNMWFDAHFKVKPLRVEFQHDPRGNTAKVYFTTQKDNDHFIIWYVLN